MTAAPLLLHVFPTFRVGGSQTRFAAIANHFAGKYRHAILALDGAYDCLDRLAPNVAVERWDVPAPKRNTVRNVLAFRRLLRERRPDLLVTYNWGAIEWALANRPRIVPHLHIEDGFGPEEAERQLLRRVLTRRIALAKSAVVLPSRTLHYLALHTWRLPADRVHHIPNGIDLARFAAAANPVPVPAGSGPVIGTVAALRPEKNIARLLQAVHGVQQSTPCRLIVAGDGPERPRLEVMAGEMLAPGSFAFLGNINEVERVYASLDIFALSSDTEQMPTSLMEAMAAGLPVASTAVGDVSRMVAAENQTFVTVREDHAFAQAIFRLVADPMTRNTAGIANFAQAKAAFGIARMHSAYLSVFSSLLIH